MAYSKKKPSQAPTTRTLKKLKAKLDSKPNDFKLIDDYLITLSVMGKYDELNESLIKYATDQKGKKTMARHLFVIVNGEFDKVSPEAKEIVADNYLEISTDLSFDIFDSGKFNIKFRNYLLARAKELDISLEQSKEGGGVVLEEAEEEITNEESLVSLSADKRQESLDKVYEIFSKNKNKEWEKNKDLIKAIFKIAKNMRNLDYEKAQELLDYCLVAFPSNGNYQRVNNKWNPPVLEEGAKEVETVEIVKDNKIRVIIPLDKQIYTEEELFKLVPKLKIIFDTRELKGLIDEENTKFRKDRRIGSILISIAGIIVIDPTKSEKAFDIYKVIEDMNIDGELRTKEIRQSNILKYNILVAQGKYEEAEEWNDNEELGMEPEGVINDVVELTESIAVRDDAQDIFHKRARNEAIRFYRKSVDSYINNGQFKHKLGEEVSEVVIENIKDKIAIDLQYLDFEIRELLIPYFIKVEANAKIVLKQYRGVIGNLIYKAFNNYTDDLRFVIDVSKVKETGFKDEELFQRFLLSFRALRNHMVHGSPNMFALKIYEDKRTGLKSETDYDDAISFFEETGNTNIDEILTKAKQKISGVDIFKLPIVEKVLSYDAVENKRGFGLALIILFMTTPRYTFLRISSEIDHKINIFKNRTVLGSKNKLYEALGINPNWIKELSNIEE